MTGARPDTWMPFYWGDYRADTPHLTAAQHGAYMLLIGRYWTSGKPLPDLDDQLARIAAMTTAEWRRHRPVIAEFFQVADGLWRHGRIEREIAAAAKGYAKRAGAAAVRWSKADAMNGAKHDAMHMQPEPQPQPEPDLEKEVRGMISSAARKTRGPSARRGLSALERKQVWAQNVMGYLSQTLPSNRAEEVIAAYLEGAEWAQIEFNRASEAMQARKAGTA